MTWTRALSYVGMWLLLSAYYVLSDRPAPEVNEQPARRATPGPFGAIDAAEIVQLTFQSGNHSVRAERSGTRWRVIEPAGAAVPADLFSALVSAVLAVPQAEVVAVEGRAAEFGLDRPVARLTFARTDGQAVIIALGARNPAETAIYARRDGAAEAVLLGLNVPYYLDLVLRAGRPPPG